MNAYFELSVWYLLVHMDLDARKPVFASLRTTKAQTSLRIRTVIVLPRSNDRVYICFFVNIEIKTLGLHIQQSGVVLKAIRYQLV